MDHRKKPGSPGDILRNLRHYGIKGMRWGIRKQDDLGGLASKSAKTAATNNTSTKAYMAANQKLMDAPGSEEQLAANKEKFLRKFESSDGKVQRVDEKGVSPPSADGKKGLTEQQKKALIKVGIGVGVVGGVVALTYLQKKKILGMAGKPIDAETFKKHTLYSQLKTWGNSSYIQPQSFTREGFELPAGHVFHRISTRAETGFSHNSGTYSVHSIEDYHRYIAGFRQEKGIGVDLHHVSWTSTEPIKVPALTEVLDTLRHVMREEVGSDDIHETEVLTAYRHMSGGGWSGPREKSLMKALRARGYGAIVDEMDAGVIGETPLVFFSEHVSSKASVPITPQGIAQAEQSLIEIKNRKL